MKIKFSEGGIVIISTSNKETKELYRLWDEGHLHFVCKSLDKRSGPTAKLLLAPSVIRWVKGRTRKGHRTT